MPILLLTAPSFRINVEREPLTNQLIANVTFSNYPYTGDRQPRCDETFDFRFPGLRFDAAHQIFFARTGRHEWIPVAEWRSTQPRDGARWVENDNNLSLQNLLTSCFAVFCR